MHVVHDALEQILLLVLRAVGVLAVRERRIVLEVEFWNVVETAHECAHCTEDAVEEHGEAAGDGDLALEG